MTDDVVNCRWLRRACEVGRSVRPSVQRSGDSNTTSCQSRTVKRSIHPISIRLSIISQLIIHPSTNISMHLTRSPPIYLPFIHLSVIHPPIHLMQVVPSQLPWEPWTDGQRDLVAMLFETWFLEASDTIRQSTGGPGPLAARGPE